MMIICIHAPHLSQTQTNCLGMIYQLKEDKGLDSSQLLNKRSLNGSGPANINLGIFFVPLMFARFPNQSPLLTML